MKNMLARIAFALFALALCTSQLTLVKPATSNGGKPTIQVELGHTEFVRRLALSGDGEYLFSSSDDRTVRVWERRTGRESRAFSFHKAAVTALCAASDSGLFASGDESGVIAWWAEWSESPTGVFSAAAPILDLRFDIDGKRLRALCADGSMLSIDPSGEATTDERRFVSLHGGLVVSKGAFDAAGATVAMGFDDGSVLVASGKTGWKPRFLESRDRVVSAVALSSNGAWLCACDYGGSMRLYSIDGTPRIVAQTKLPAFERTLGHAMLVDGEAKRVYYSDFSGNLVKAGFDLKKIAWTSIPTFPLALALDGKRATLFCGTGDLYWRPDAPDLTFFGFKNSILELSSEDLSAKGDYSGKLYPLLDARFFAGGGKLALGGSDERLHVIDLVSGKVERTFAGHEGEIRKVAVLSDDDSIVSCAWDGTVRVWSLSGRRETRIIRASETLIEELSVSPDESRVAIVASGGYVGLVDPVGGRVVKERRLPSGMSNFAVAFSPDGARLAVGDAAGRIVLLDAATLDTVAEHAAFEGDCKEIRFSPDGSSIFAIGSGNAVARVGLGDGKTLWKQTLPGTAYMINALDVSPDRRWVLVGNASGAVFKYDAVSGELEKTLAEHQSYVFSVSYASGGKFYVTCGRDSTFRVFRASDDTLLCSGMTDPDGREYLFWTPQGYFSGTKTGIMSFAHVTDGHETYGIDQFFERYYRPDKVLAAFAGETGKEPGPFGERIAKLPALAIEIVAGNPGKTETVVDGSSVRDKDVTVRVRVTDRGGGIGPVRVYDNGKLVGSATRGEGDKAPVFERAFRISLAEGENRVRAVATAADGTETDPAVVVVTHVPGRSAKPNLFILAIGIDQYRNANYALEYCVADAMAFVEALTPKARKLFGDVFVDPVLDRQASKAEILRRFDDLRERIAPSDVFVLFYSGHGIAQEALPGDPGSGTEFYYVLSEVTQMHDPARVSLEGISGTEMRELLSGIKATKQVLFIDACNSGAFARQFSARGAAEESALAKLSRSTGSVIFASTTKDQEAFEYESLGHGIFTYVLIEAVDGAGSLANGQLTAASLKAYIDDKIPEYTQKFRGQEQYPTTFLWGQDFPLGLR